MEELRIQPTKNSPEIVLSPDGLIKIRGRSIHENAAEFYESVETWINEYVEMFFLALAAGSILYIIGELIHLGRLRGGHLMMTSGLLLGFFIAFASDLFIEYAVNRGLDKQIGQKTVSIEAGEYYFKPNVIEVEAGQPIKLMITNTGEAEHEFEIFAKGLIFEQVLPAGKTTPVYLDLRYPGKVPFICDMPGHLGGGMYGHIIVRPAAS